MLKCHIKCGRISPSEFKQRSCHIPWTCPLCLFQELPTDTNDITPNRNQVESNQFVNNWSALPFRDGFYSDDPATDFITHDDLNDCDFSTFNTNGMHHIHIRSLPPKIDELRFLASKTNATTISITETWLDYTVTDNEIKIDRYNVFRKDRDREGSGVCVHVRTNRAATR